MAASAATLWRPPPRPLDGRLQSHKWRARRNQAAAGTLRSLRGYQSSAGPRRALHYKNGPRKSWPSNHLRRRTSHEFGSCGRASARYRAPGSRSGVHGTGFHTFTNTFNLFFDPEAGRKVLRAPWPKLTIVPVDLAEQVHEGDEIAP